MLLSCFVGLAHVACADHDAPPVGPRIDPRIDQTLPTVHVRATDPDTHGVLACKVTIVARAGGADPNWQGTGEPDHVGLWLHDAVLSGRTAVASRCDFDLPLAAGSYDITVSNGPEREIVLTTLTVGGATLMARIDASLARAVDSSGWACGDLHVHSAPSIDSDVPLDQRLVAATAEGLDVIVPTDHDAREPWAPALRAEHLESLVHVIEGDEISPGSWDAEHKGHFNVYPVPSGVRVPEDLPFAGLTVAQIVDRARANVPDAILQINHPRWDAAIGYFDVIDLDRLTGMGAMGETIADFDAIEVWNGHELDLAPGDVAVEEVLADWYALLNRGHLMVATGNSDTHRLSKTPVGYPRTCVRVTNDAPGSISDGDFVEGLRHGQAFVTSGIFVDLLVGGQSPGETIAPADGSVPIEMHLQAASWVPMTELDVIVDGEVVQTLAVPAERPASLTTSISVTHDAFVLVVVRGDGPLGPAAGAHAAATRSLAFTNPVFVDADRDGRWTPQAP